MHAMTRAAGAALLVSAVSVGSLQADVWVFEPSVTLGQRFDDNFFLDTIGGSNLSATRGIGHSFSVVSLRQHLSEGWRELMGC